MKVVIAGASGFLGSALVAQLRDHGHNVTTLVRRPVASSNEALWRPDRGELSPDVIAGADAVVCLSGAGIGDKRWTESYRRELRTSRIGTTELLVRTMTALPSGARPQVFIAGSAMGIYGDRGDEVLTESSALGTGFLADITRDWEAAARPAADAGIRVVNLRTSHVLAAHGGLLHRLVPIFKLGGGGRLGSGRQYMSWISLRDHVAATMRLLDDNSLDGPVNVNAGASTNAEFTRVLAAALHRPVMVPVPRFAMRIAVGGVADDALSSQRLSPGVLTKAGFVFEHKDLESAMAWAVDH